MPLLRDGTIGHLPSTTPSSTTTTSTSTDTSTGTGTGSSVESANAADSTDFDIPFFQRLQQQPQQANLGSDDRPIPDAIPGFTFAATEPTRNGAPVPATAESTADSFWDIMNGGQEGELDFEAFLKSFGGDA